MNAETTMPVRLLGFQENSVHFGDIILFHWHSFPETANEIALKLQAIRKRFGDIRLFLDPAFD